VTGEHGHGSPALWVAIAATVLSLGLPLVGDVPGRDHIVRVLLVGAIVLLIVAVAGARQRRTREHLVVASLGLLVFTVALLVRAISPTGVVLLSIAIGSLLWQRRAWARATD
jgi:chromate transport protein ChrA